MNCAAWPLPTARRADAALERGHALLEDRGGGVHDAGIDVAEALQVEQRGGVLGVVEDVRGGLVDGHGARTGFGVRTLAGVQRAGVEAENVVAGPVAVLVRHGIPRKPEILPCSRQALRSQHSAVGCRQAEPIGPCDVESRLLGHIEKAAQEGGERPAGLPRPPGNPSENLYFPTSLARQTPMHPDLFPSSAEARPEERRS